MTDLEHCPVCLRSDCWVIQRPDYWCPRAHTIALELRKSMKHDIDAANMMAKENKKLREENNRLKVENEMWRMKFPGIASEDTSDQWNGPSMKEAIQWPGCHPPPKEEP